MGKINISYAKRGDEMLMNLCPYSYSFKFGLFLLEEKSEDYCLTFGELFFQDES